MGVILRLLSAILLLICAAAAFGGLRAAIAGRPPLRGELVDIGGRRLRMVCEGPRSGRPLIVMESGIFGFAADWAAVQTVLAQRGLRSCAYDRAGLGFSDPGPYPRDGLAIVTDLEKLLKAKGETGPLILVGHSMAGLHTRLFILRNPERVKGLVLVDAASPDALLGAEGRQRAALFRTAGRAAVAAGKLGLMKAAAPWAGDPIGLDGPAHAEKVYFWADNRHHRRGDRRDLPGAGRRRPGPRGRPARPRAAGGGDHRGPLAGPERPPARGRAPVPPRLVDQPA